MINLYIGGNIMNHLGTVKLETSRLLLRPFNINDANCMYNNWANDDNVTKYLTWKSYQSIDDANFILNEWTKSYDNKDFYQWAIVLKEIDEPIGSISVVEINEKVNMVTIGYCIGKKWWHKGITSEAFERIIKFLFDEVKVNRIQSRHDVENENSGKVMKKCGLKYEGTLRQSDFNNQGVVDLCMYAILAEDYYT